MEENANPTGSRRYSTFGPRYNTNNNNNNNGATNQSQSYPEGILKKSPPQQDRKTPPTEDDQAEAWNEEVIKRVAEMRQILNAAEEFLDDDGDATDAESMVTQKSGTESELSSNYGNLKHSDFLHLLTQQVNSSILSGFDSFELKPYHTFCFFLPEEIIIPGR